MTKLTSLLLAIGMFATPIAAYAQTPPPPAPVVATPAPAPAVAVPAPAESPAATAEKVAAPAPLLPVAGEGMPTPGAIHLQEQVTPNGRQAEWIHDSVLLPIITVISALVLALLIWVIVRYRRAANPVASRTSHNTVIEVVWTLLPVLILLFIAVPSISLLAAQFKPAPKNALTIKAIGNQWYWTYEYPDNGGFEIVSNMLKEPKDAAKGERARTDADGPARLAVDNRIVMPVGVPIKLIVTSNDVIHSWAIPAFWTKMDAVPGRLNEVSFTIEKPGLYFGQCSELCGARHGFMPIAVEAVSPARFAQWVRSKGGSMPGDKPAGAAAATEAAPAAPATNQAAPAAASGN
ncbi:MAG: cytochrome c oxidase subunit II [Sphingomonas sanxanigenens]|uniref:Cytochrome c oxidase subunit 2 n=1 Tax=Sphingomonas sanxanigenens TaxID=397260 RepID=A0A2W5AAE4_9SPHN|nr:MAG: cytochrome c oxidase subunit II [Sphingomonas sanxanigenens]